MKRVPGSGGEWAVRHGRGRRYDPQDMALVRTHTAHVAGLPLEADNVGGDPSPCTARGVFPSMELAAHRRLHRPLSDCTIAIQGVGHVGVALVQMLHQAGAQLLVSDVNAAAAARVANATGATVVSAAGILSAKADIFAPCALGGVIDALAAGKARAKVLSGCAAPTADGRENPRHDPRQFGRTRPLGRQNH